jgi:hypothetical protein
MPDKETVSEKECPIIGTRKLDRDHPTWLDLIAHEMWAHYHHRYEIIALKKGMSHLSFNEIVGIVARRRMCPDAWERPIGADDLNVPIYDSTTIGSTATEHIAGRLMNGPDSRNWIEKAAEEIFAHLRERYQHELKTGRSDLTTNEAIGIIAKHAI